MILYQYQGFSFALSDQKFVSRRKKIIENSIAKIYAQNLKRFAR